MKLSRKQWLVIRKAWSMKLLVAAGCLSGLEAAMPFVQPWMDRRVFACVMLLIVGGAFVARLLAQKEMEDE